MALAIHVAGAGRAGRARERALRSIAAEDGTILFEGLVSRRGPVPIGSVDGAEVYACVWDDAFRPAADAGPAPRRAATIISTETSSHTELAARAIASGRHVCVEYPLCTSTHTGRELMRAAAAAGVCLHVEHIELIATDKLCAALMHAQTSADMDGAGKRQLEIRFTGALLTAQGEGVHPAFAGMARFTRVWTLLGPLVITRAHTHALATPGHDGGAATRAFTMQVQLTTADGRWNVSWEETRHPSAQRQTVYVIHTRRGGRTVDEYLAENGIAVPATADGGLFMQDSRHFIAKCRAVDAGDCVHTDAELERELQWLALAEAIATAAPMPP